MAVAQVYQNTPMSATPGQAGLGGCRPVRSDMQMAIGEEMAMMAMWEGMAIWRELAICEERPLTLCSKR